MKLLFIIMTLLALNAFANPTSKKENKHQHREHEAHVHGGGNLAIAFDDAKGKIEFKGASEGILGFEHQPRSEKDKKIVADAIQLFEKEIAKIVKFDPSLQCRFTKELIGQVPEEGEEGSGEHSDWAANFSVACDRSPVGTVMSVDLTGFKRLKDVDVTVLIGSIQKSAEYKGKTPVTIELK